MSVRGVTGRWQRGLLFVLLLLAVLYCGASYVSGKLAFNALNNEVKRLNNHLSVSPWLLGGQGARLHVVRDRSGIFSSDWHLEWREQAEVKTSADGWLSEHKLFHGPFPWSTIKQGNWKPFLAHDFFSSSALSGQTLLDFTLAGKTWGAITPEAGHYQIIWTVNDELMQRELETIEAVIEIEEEAVLQWTEDRQMQKKIKRGIKTLERAGLVIYQNQRLQLAAQVFLSQERIIINGKDVSLAALMMLGMGILLQ